MDSSTTSSDSRENPLLGDKVFLNNERYLRYKAARSEGSCSLCGCLGHLVVFVLPLLAMVFMLAFLIILAVFDQSEIQQSEMYGYESLEGFYNMTQTYYASVSSDTISIVMSQYEPYTELLALASVACILTSLVTIIRNIQIEVYQKRTGSFIFMKFINYLSAIINILAYAGLMVAINFKVTQEEPVWASQAHFVGFLTFFAGTAAYSVLHSFLLLNQSEYPRFVKGLFLVLAIVIVASSLSFGMPIWLNGLSSDEGGYPVAEWVAVFTSALSIGLYVILFFIDPVDNVLSSFFCGGTAKSQKESKQNSRIQLQQMHLEESRRKQRQQMERMGQYQI